VRENCARSLHHTTPERVRRQIRHSLDGRNKCDREKRRGEIAGKFSNHCCEQLPWSGQRLSAPCLSLHLGDNAFLGRGGQGVECQDQPGEAIIARKKIRRRNTQGFRHTLHGHWVRVMNATLVAIDACTCHETIQSCGNTELSL